MKKYLVTLQSNDNNLYEITVECDYDHEAELIALNAIEVKGWTQYNYKMIQLQRLK